MRTVRIVLCLATASIWTAAFTKPAFLKDVKDTYGIKSDSKIAKASCAFCHLGKTTKLNTYGLDLQKAMTQENTKVLTGSVLKKVEGMDSDKDGRKNIEEIKRGTLPGDAKNK